MGGKNPKIETLDMSQVARKTGVVLQNFGHLQEKSINQEPFLITGSCDLGFEDVCERNTEKERVSSGYR
jgi:hypothetical protein